MTTPTQNIRRLHLAGDVISGNDIRSAFSGILLAGDGRDLMMDAPAEIDERQLKELHIKVEKKE